MEATHPREIWCAAGVRTPFSRIDGPLAHLDALGLSVPVARAMLGRLAGARPDFAVWGAVAPSLMWSNLAREVMLEAGLPQEIPAFSTVMACSTSMMGAFEAAGMIRNSAHALALVGGVDSLSRIQIGLGQSLSDWLRRLGQARSLGQRLARLAALRPRDLRLHIPSITNRSTGLSMGEHTEITAKEWSIGREAQDRAALESHRRAGAAREAGFFDDLLIPVDEVRRDNLPRETPAVKLLDWEIAAVDIRSEGLLMAPAYAIPRLLARNRLGYADVDLWEIHEAFAAQLLFHMDALDNAAFLKEKVGVEPGFGPFPRERVNPNGGSVALGHPFGATGARILSQAVKELAQRPAGCRAIVSICADGGLGTVALLESAPRPSQ